MIQAETPRIAAADLAVVKAILADCLPPEVSVAVFGSRARGRPKAWSDLDLVLEGPAPLSLALMARLAEAFDESPLPWKVDLVDRRTVAAPFGRIIDTTKIALPLHD